MSPEREGRDEEEEEEEGGRTNFAFDMDSENEGTRSAGLRGKGGGPRNGGTLKSLVVGNQRRRGTSETDIVSDIYTTAFSKVPKVRLSTAGENYVWMLLDKSSARFCQVRMRASTASTAPLTGETRLFWMIIILDDNHIIIDHDNCAHVYYTLWPCL